MVSAAVASLTFGLAWPDPQLSGGRAPFPQDFVVLAADEPSQTQAQAEENADESAKMGKEAGTHTDNQAATPQSDSKKIDQPPSNEH
jgi:hypothetical protein